MALSLRGLVSKVGALALVAALQMATAQTSSESKARPKAEMERLAIEASAVKSRHAKELMDLPAVVGHGVGLSKKAPRKPAIEVYVSRKLTEEERKKFPENLEGVPVVILETGEFHALPKGKKETKKPSQQKSTDSPADSSNFGS